MFQFGQLVPELTCLENVAMPLRLDGTPRARRGAGERRGSSGWRSRTWRSNARRRCPAARASGSRWPARWSTGPRVVFADEPTGALDSLNGERVMQLLAAARESGAAVVLVTHETRVAAYADREIVVRDGKTRDVTVPRGQAPWNIASAAMKADLALSACGWR